MPSRNCNSSFCFSEKLERSLASHVGLELRVLATEYFQVPKRPPGPALFTPLDLAVSVFSGPSLSLDW